MTNTKVARITLDRDELRLLLDGVLASLTAGFVCGTDLRPLAALQKRLLAADAAIRDSVLADITNQHEDAQLIAGRN